VLVAEDEESLRGMLAVVLEGAGYEVLLCSDGLRAREALAGPARIDLALLDLRMPGLGGAQLIEFVRGHPPRAALPLVAMSAFSDDFSAQALLAAGADAFLAKPFTIQELTQLISQLLGQRSTPPS